MTNPANEKKSIGLPLDASVVMVFASPTRQLYHDVTNPAHLPGLSHLLSYRDTEILPTYRDFAKTHANPDPSLRSGQAPTATPHTTGPLEFI